MNSHPALLSIVAYARSGALDHAWRLFAEAGLNRLDDDPAVLSVRGRLLKDRALAAPAGAGRRGYYLDAAEAYAEAGRLGVATYPLINAATLSLLAGQTERSRTLARQVLDRLDRREGEPDTPYYQAATRAEALLLTGQAAEARAAFAEAIAVAPRAWEDHASSLRQFGLILDELGEDKRWLDPLRPPRCLHFAGHMALESDEAAAGRQIRQLLDRENVGFGYGALAAGADIMIAEALLERGAELHLILPGGRRAFEDASVAGFGGGWAARFETALERADTVRGVGDAGDPTLRLRVILGAEAAMGQAVMHAETLMTEAVQLLILDEAAASPGGDGASGWIRSTWQASGRRQHVITAPRGRRKPSPAPSVETSACLAAELRVEVSGADGGELAPADWIVSDVFPALSRAMTGVPAPLVAPRWSNGAVSMAYGGVADGATAALVLAEALKGLAGFRIAGCYGVAHRARDPFDGAPILLGRAAGMLAEMIASVPPDAVHLTEDFAAALHAGPAEGRPRTEYVGDLPQSDPEEPIRLYALKR